MNFLGKWEQLYQDHLNGVMISMLTWNVKDCGFNTQSGQTKEELRRVGSKSG
jgi:hypothetical protein